MTLRYEWVLNETTDPEAWEANILVLGDEPVTDQEATMLTELGQETRMAEIGLRQLDLIHNDARQVVGYKAVWRGSKPAAVGAVLGSVVMTARDRMGPHPAFRLVMSILENLDLVTKETHIHRALPVPAAPRAPDPGMYR